MLRVVCALIVFKDKILVTQRGPETDHPFLWEFPGGKIIVDETPENAIKREIKEELELEIQIVSAMVPVTFDYGFRKIELIPFLCSVQEGQIKLNEHFSFQLKEWNELDEVEFSGADKKLILNRKNQEILKEYFGKKMNNS